MKNTKLIIIVLVVVGAAVAAFFIFGRGGVGGGQLTDLSSGGAKEDTPAVVVAGSFKKGQPAPEVTFSDFDNNLHNLSDYKGKPVILDFWAAWCPFCVAEMPELQATQDKYGDDLVIIGMHRTSTESITKGRSFAKDRGVSYLLGTDPNDSLYRATGGFGMPVAVFIDSEGVVAEIKSGPKTSDEIQEKSANLLKKN